MCFFSHDQLLGTSEESARMLSLTNTGICKIKVKKKGVESLGKEAY